MAKAPKKKQLGGLISAARRLMKSPVTKRTTNKIKKEVTGEYYNLKNAMKEIKKRSNNSPKKKQMGGMPPVPVDSMKKYLPPPPSSGKTKRPVSDMPTVDKKMGDPTQIQRLKPYKQMGGPTKGPVKDKKPKVSFEEYAKKKGIKKINTNKYK